jgi:hypothetical protein
VQRLAPVRSSEEKSNACEECPGDRVVITLGVAVYAANALVETANDARQLLVEIDVFTSQQQVGRRTEMGFVSPLFFGEPARKQALAKMGYLGVSGKQAWRIFGHGIGS